MADVYALEFVGGPDGTSMPPKKLDGRLVSAKKRRTRAAKPTSVVLNVGDRLYIGKLPQDAVLQALTVNTDTSFGTTTLSIGTTLQPTKYVNGKTVTATDVPTGIGPSAAAARNAPVTADEDLWVTIGTAAIAAAVLATFYMEYTIAT